MTAQQNTAKPHYESLDGLRGVAAIIVVAFHVFEAVSTSHFDQILNHGYLAVDFFFVLSGFVIGYAYNDRWTTLSIGNFIKRRFIRLYPMIFLGGLTGALLFYAGSGTVSPAVAGTPTGMFLLGTAAACLLIPLPRSLDIRGWDEMYPLNGPQWSLFFEILANLSYACVLRRLGTRMLALLTLLAAIATTTFLLTNGNGDIIGGWALNPRQLTIGLIRLAYPFLCGLLLARLRLRLRVRHAFITCAAILAAALCFPRVGGTSACWANALYESFCIIIVFPLIVVICSSQPAGSSATARQSHPIISFLGTISYPLYLTHYPFIYMYFEYIRGGHGATVAGTWFWGTSIVIGSTMLAYAFARYYEIPVRRWLRRLIPC